MNNEIEILKEKLERSEQEKAHLISAMQDNWCLMQRAKDRAAAAQARLETLEDYLLKEDEPAEVRSPAALPSLVLQ